MPTSFGDVYAHLVFGSDKIRSHPIGYECLNFIRVKLRIKLIQNDVRYFMLTDFMIHYTPAIVLSQLQYMTCGEVVIDTASIVR